jgi:UDP-N-acetylglucosamine 4,6-dehydratase
LNTEINFSRSLSDYNELVGSSILITGGTGSFGQAFVHKVLKELKPERLVIYSRDELKQSEMARKYGEEQYPCIRYFIGDVRDRERLELALRDIEHVVHAAALKQVPTAEYNPFECIHTNVLGTENVVRAALNTRVKSVLFLSTDKAVNPVNLYGASKLAAERICIAANNMSGHKGARFSVVRYGNVIGSRGSVVELFAKLIQNKTKELPITDERMTRFWLTLEQGVDFVLSCFPLMRGGEVFVPKIPSMRIIELAACMAPDLPLTFIGIRPGEKLHEVLLTTEEARNTLDFSDRYIIEPDLKYWVRPSLGDLGGTNLQEGFRLTSDKNEYWLDKSTIAAFVEPYLTQMDSN